MTNATRDLAIINLPGKEKVIGTIIEEDDEAFIVDDPMKIYIIETSRSAMIGLERYDMMSSKHITLFYKNSVVSVNTNVSGPMEAYYKLKVKLYQGFLDQHIQEWLEKAANDLSEAFNETGQVDMKMLERMMSARLSNGDSMSEDDDLFIPSKTLH